MNSPIDYARALLDKARDDGYVLKTLAIDAAAPDWILGFHAQQAVEKALKTVLASQGVEYPRTHNLAMLMELLRRQKLEPPPDGDELGRLTPFGVALRYDGYARRERACAGPWVGIAGSRSDNSLGCCIAVMSAEICGCSPMRRPNSPSRTPFAARRQAGALTGASVGS
ncbi:MAG: HEPN domain-containing protein [Sulfuritalea sp.]|nr:HEPN domain-containing protein [Sulfuritalea sp.]